MLCKSFGVKMTCAVDCFCPHCQCYLKDRLLIKCLSRTSDWFTQNIGIQKFDSILWIHKDSKFDKYKLSLQSELAHFTNLQKFKQDFSFSGKLKNTCVERHDFNGFRFHFLKKAASSGYQIPLSLSSPVDLCVEFFLKMALLSEK